MDQVSKKEKDLAEKRSQKVLEYRKKCVMLLSSISKRMEELDESDYDIFGDIPAYPSEYTKEGWEQCYSPIKEIVSNCVLPELDSAIARGNQYQYCYQIFKTLIQTIVWSEI